MIKISMQEDLLVKELDVLKNMRGLLEQLLQTSKEKEVRQCTETMPKPCSENVSVFIVYYSFYFEIGFSKSLNS